MNNTVYDTAHNHVVFQIVLDAVASPRKPVKQHRKCKSILKQDGIQSSPDVIERVGTVSQ